jgi:hypothetical protein
VSVHSWRDARKIHRFSLPSRAAEDFATLAGGELENEYSLNFDPVFRRLSRY